MSGKAWIIIWMFTVCFFSVYGADGSLLWDEGGVPITLNGTSQYNFDIATDQNGGLFFAWEADNGYEIALQKIDYTGETGDLYSFPGPAWGSAVILSSGLSGGNQNPDVISDNAGGAIVAWVEKISSTPINTWVYKARRVNGSGAVLWAAATSLTSSYMDVATSQPKPILVSDGGSGAFAAVQSDGSCHVVHIRSDGTLSGGLDGVDLGFNLGVAASDGAGGVIVAGLNGLSVMAGRVILEGGTVKSIWTPGGAAVGSTTAVATAIHAVADGAGGAIVSWNASNNVRIQRLSGGGAALWNSGGLELVSSAAVGGVWTFGITSDVCSNGAEGAFAVWTDWRNEPSTGANCDIYAQHINSDGQIVWSQYGVRINSLTPGSQRYPVICPDAVGGAIAAWQDYYGLSYNIRACRINAADGSRDWSIWAINDDVPPSTPGADQLYPKILFAADGPSPQGAILAWKDKRAARANYCQKVEIDTAVAPLPPSNLSAALTSSQIHLTWKDNSANEAGFRIEYKKWRRYSFEPTEWTVLDTTGPDAMSYQVDEASNNYYYKFRVCSFNTYGDSAYSNEASILVGLLLNWINIHWPNGGESLAVGAERQIRWSSSSGITKVTIDYSIDGGSHWIYPPIAAGIWNTGSYLWNVPATLSDHCILRIRDTSGSVYDLSDQPFRIVPAGPDLIVEKFSCDQQETAIQKKDLDFHCTVRNVGSVAADGFYIDFYSDRDTPPAPRQYGDLYIHISSGLAPNASVDWDFNYSYPIHGNRQIYLQVDTDEVVPEADEKNNGWGPHSLKVREFEFIEATPGTTNWWFGGDNRSGSTRNIGYGQSFTLPRSAHVDYAGFRFSQRFDYYENPEGIGHAVTLILNIRAENGTIIKTVAKNLPASFNGGWAFFDVDADLWAGQTYIFTFYLQNGHVNKLMSYIYARQDDPWPNSQGYLLHNATPPYGMEDWTLWETHPWDFNFRIAGIYTDLSKADFTRNYWVDLEDAVWLAARWLRADCQLPTWCNLTDLDYSGQVDLQDLDDWSDWWLWDGYGRPDHASISAMEVQLSTSRISGSDGVDFWPGTYFLYKTSENRYGKFIVENMEPDNNHRMTIGWTTYNADGTIYSTGTGLAIRGTYYCDLDAGAETSVGADWLWEQNTTTVRHLGPQNGAKFKLMYRAPEP